MSSKSLFYDRVARDMQEAEQIQAEVRTHASRATETAESRPDGELELPRTPTEKWLAAAWGEFLGLERVDVNTDFFELGGDSLSAMRILSRAREEFRVSLPPTVLFATDFTVVEIARLIDERQIEEQIEEIGADGVAEMLEELEALSDEEVEALLAGEEPATA
jgi:acyl carrier protein